MGGGGRGVKGMPPREVGNTGEQSRGTSLVNLVLCVQSEKCIPVGETEGFLLLELREKGCWLEMGASEATSVTGSTPEVWPSPMHLTPNPVLANPLHCLLLHPPGCWNGQ